MSSGNSAIDAQFAVAYRSAVIEDYCYIAGAALLLYDTAITLGQEVELIWIRRRSAVTVLFLVNRVLSIMMAVSMVLGAPNWPQLTSCTGITTFGMIPQLLLFFVWAAFSALRVYAIGGQAWRTASLVFILSCAPFATNLYIDTKYQFQEYPLAYICVAIPSTPTNILIIMEVIARTSVIISDAIVLGVTWQHTYSLMKHASAVNVKTSLATLLLRDGTIFFVTLLALNAAQLGNYIRLITASGTDISYWVTTFSCIVVSRFILGLRQLSQQDTGATNAAGPSFVASASDLRFSPGIVDNIGAELDVSIGLFSSSLDEDSLDSEYQEEMKTFSPEPQEDVLPAVVEEIRIPASLEA